MSEVNSIEWLKKAKEKGATHVAIGNNNFLYLIDDTGVFAGYMNGDDSWHFIQSLNETRDHMVEIDYSLLEEHEAKTELQYDPKDVAFTKNKTSDCGNSVDMVNHPPHYQSHNGVECLDAIEAALGEDGYIAYLRGQVIKYTWRLGKKWDAVEDAKKAEFYNARLIQKLTERANETTA